MLSVVGIARAAVLVAGGLAILYACERCSPRLTPGDVAPIRRALVAAGFELATTSRHVEDAAPELADRAGAARAAGAAVVAGVRVVTREVPFLIPCPVTPPAGADTGGPVAPASPLSVLVSATAEHVIAADPIGGIHVASRLWARLRVGGWSEDRELPVDAADVRVDPALVRAWAGYVDRPSRLTLRFRPPRHWRAGWVAGVGVSYSLDGRIAPALFAGYGAQF